MLDCGSTKPRKTLEGTLNLKRGGLDTTTLYKRLVFGSMLVWGSVASFGSEATGLRGELSVVLLALTSCTARKSCGGGDFEQGASESGSDSKGRLFLMYSQSRVLAWAHVYTTMLSKAFNIANIDPAPIL